MDNANNNDMGISIITITNKPNNFRNIINNYSKQELNKKELILVLNNNSMSLKKYNHALKKYPNTYVYQLDEKVSLGNCLNYAIEHSNYNIVAKFDDDDYYGAKYLSNSLKTMIEKEALVLGKSTSYVYFKSNKVLAIRNLNKENKFVRRVEGPTFLIRKEVFSIIKFPDKSLGEDVQFCKDCIRNMIPIYSSDKKDFVYIREINKSNHTWKINDDFYLKLCKIIGKYDNFREYIDF